MPGTGDPFLERLYLSLRDLIADQRSLILAVSGGADSVALMIGATRLSDRLKTKMLVVTVDHGLRRDSGREARAVIAAAKALGLPGEVRRVALGRGPGVEARARVKRYAALESARKRRRFAWVATAHTASDQAETLLHRLSRGAALLGAASILERRDRVIRPLLFATRSEVRAWLAAQGVGWFDDPMNADRTLTRVRMREQVMPRLEEATDARVAVRLSRFARFAADDDAHLQGEADRAFDALRAAGGGFEAKGLKALSAPIARRVLARWLREEGLAVDGELVERMREVIENGGVTGLPKRRLLKCRRGNATIVIE